ncbi:MAG: hypothetical protein NVS4B8_03340 [Herpetosiphon sp.]
MTGMGTHEATTIAREQLAKKLGCSPQELIVVEVTAVTWPTSALGCPEAEMMYAQILIPGFRVTLQQDAKQYTVHTDHGKRAVVCNQQAT